MTGCIFQRFNQELGPNNLYHYAGQFAIFGSAYCMNFQKKEQVYQLASASGSLTLESCNQEDVSDQTLREQLKGLSPLANIPSIRCFPLSRQKLLVLFPVAPPKDVLSFLKTNYIVTQVINPRPQRRFSTSFQRLVNSLWKRRL
jgi:hypothetical protein